MGLLDGKIAKLVAGALKSAKMTQPAVLTKFVMGTRTPDHLAEGTNDTSNTYAAKGFVSNDKFDKIGGTLVEQNDRVVCLLGATIAGKQVPTTKDRVTIGGITSVIMAVDVDAAKAVYTCLTKV